MTQDETDDRVEQVIIHPSTQIELDAKDRQISYLHTELEKMMQKIKGVSGAGPALANPNNSFNQQGVDQHDISAIYNDIDNLNSTIEALRRDNSKLRNHLKKLGEHPDDELKVPTVLGGLKEKIRHLESLARINEETRPRDEGRKNYERDRIVQLETEQSKLLREYHSLEERVSGLKRELEAGEKARGKVEERFKRAVEELEGLKKTCIEVMGKNGELEAKLKLVSRDSTKTNEGIVRLQQTHGEEVKALKKNLEVTNEKIYLLTHDNDNRKTYFEIEKIHGEEKKALDSQIRGLKDKIDELQSENSQMDSKLKEQHSIIVELLEKKQVLEEDSSGLKQLQPHHARIKEELSDTSKERDEALQRIKSLERELYMLKEERARGVKEIEDLITTKSRLSREKDAVEIQLKIAQEELIDTKSKLLNTSNTKSDIEKNMNQFKSENEKKEEVVRLNKEELIRLSKALADKTKEVEGLTKDREFLKYRVERLENHFYQREKEAAWGEVEKIVDQENRIRHLIGENDRLKEDLLGKCGIKKFWRSQTMGSSRNWKCTKAKEWL